jgi:4-amino-4-deoxy-L-arabinose transferase-like glycosyltransferase
VTDTSTRAFSDPLLVLCLVAAAWAALWFGARPTFWRGALIGIMLGLGAATKLSPLLLAAAVGALALFPIGWGIVNRRTVAIRSGLALAMVPVVAGLTFIASYPYLWSDTITHAQRMFDFRELSFDLQALASPHARVTSLGDATRRFGVQLGERESTAGFLLGELRKYVDAGDWLWFRELDLVLAAAGWLLLVVLLFRRHFPADRVMPLLVLGGQAALIAATFRLDYARYMLPLLPAIAIGIGAVAGLLWHGAVVALGEDRVEGRLTLSGAQRESERP